jgi:hypothetical protein
LTGVPVASGQGNREEQPVGKAARRRRQHQGQPKPPAACSRTPASADRNDDPRTRAEAAIARLVRANLPGKVSLAGAYALGYAALGMAQQEGEEPDWYHELDPLDTLFLGTVWPQGFRDGYEFANARSAWLRLLRGTVHWPGIERWTGASVPAACCPAPRSPTPASLTAPPAMPRSRTRRRTPPTGWPACGRPPGPTCRMMAQRPMRCAKGCTC